MYEIPLYIIQQNFLIATTYQFSQRAIFEINRCIGLIEIVGKYNEEM